MPIFWTWSLGKWEVECRVVGRLAYGRTPNELLLRKNGRITGWFVWAEDKKILKPSWVQGGSLQG